MTERTYYKPGDYYRICDRTGFKVRNSKSKKEWNNQIVRTKSWEPRHPQDFVRGIADYQGVPEPRHRGKDVFVHIPVILTDQPAGYGPPVKTEYHSIIYATGGPYENEVAPIDPKKYPKSY
jgi:hypothetical protein